MSIVQGLTRAILYIQDMETQVRFYRDVLDMKVQFPAELDHYHDQPWVEFDTGECSLVLHISSDQQLGKDRSKLAFSVSDVAIAHKLLTERGAQLTEIRSRVDGFKVADGFDPEGNPFSIYGYQ
jgi:predicted enzyme related to lactoylglutathione lyase